MHSTRTLMLISVFWRSRKTCGDKNCSSLVHVTDYHCCCCCCLKLTWNVQPQMTTYVQNANAELQQANDQLRQVRVPVLMAVVVEMIPPLCEYLLFIFIYFFCPADGGCATAGIGGRQRPTAASSRRAQETVARTRSGLYPSTVQRPAWCMSSKPAQ